MIRVRYVESGSFFLYIYMLYVTQAVHIASQYGQTAFLDHIIVNYNADLDAPDNGGRTALHWYVLHKLLFLLSLVKSSFYSKVLRDSQDHYDQVRPHLT